MLERQKVRTLSNQGSALLWVLGLSLVGTILTTSIWSFITSLTVSSLKNTQSVAIRSLMNSLMDYTISGVRNRWCFTSTWTPNNACTLTDINNVERLLISDEAIRSVEAGSPPASYGNNISLLRTKSINANLAFSNIVPGHPLYYAATGLTNIGQNFTLTFSITRMDNGLAKGREVALQIKIDLDTVSPILGLRSNVITVVSTIMVFPREISSNALLVANNLFLDRADPGIASASPGNVYIAKQTGAGDPGVRFESPVFVNNNIYIPEENAPGYTPVTFVDKVIIGGGLILEENGGVAHPSKPLTPGGPTDRFFSQTAVFGGFLKGVLLDPSSDPGLNVLSGVQSVTPPSYTSTNLCIRRSNAKVDLSLTRESQLFIKYDSNASSEAASGSTSNVNSTYKFNVDLGAVDSFYVQGNSGAANQFNIFSPAALAPALAYTAAATTDQRPIMRAQIAINGWNQMPGAYVSADLASQGVLEIPMNPNDAAAKIKITTTPVVMGGNTQPQAVDITVELIKQEAFNIVPYGVTLSGSTVTTSYEGSIDIRLDAFDVAYVTDASLGIKSNRTLGSPADPLSSSVCPLGSNGYLNDTATLGGVTYHCYNKFAWHPIMGKSKFNGFSFARPAGGADKRFLFVRNAAATGTNGYFTCAKFDNSCVVYDSTVAPMGIDLIAFDAACNSPPSGTDLFPPFAAADWTTANFLTQTRHAWGFTESGFGTDGYNPGTLLLDASVARLDASSKPTFVVSAIYNTCRITNTANFVAGFFVCDNLVIDDNRSEPLRIIGTFIVGHMSVSPTAIQQGVRWSNIYHPSAVYELRAAGILSTGIVTQSCDNPLAPLWQPFPSIEQAQYLYKCNPVHLRAKADPFKWTQVDPDCGVVGSEMKCKNRVMRYEILELRRQEYL